MDLYVWPGDFGLPSWHQPSLAVWAYIKFTGAPCSVHTSSAPILTGAWRISRPGATWDLPVFSAAGRGGSGVLLGAFEQVVQHLERQCRFSTEVALTPKQRAESVAFRNMVEEKLAPATAYISWVIL